MINEEKMDNLLLELGHDDFNLGTKYLREAVRRYDAAVRPALTKVLYPAVAKVYSSTPSRVERCIRHSVAKAWGRGELDAQWRYFGSSINPERGAPTNGEYIARLAKICREEEA